MVKIPGSDWLYKNIVCNCNGSSYFTSGNADMIMFIAEVHSTFASSKKCDDVPAFCGFQQPSAKRSA